MNQVSFDQSHSGLKRILLHSKENCKIVYLPPSKRTLLPDACLLVPYKLQHANVDLEHSIVDNPGDTS